MSRCLGLVTCRASAKLWFRRRPPGAGLKEIDHESDGQEWPPHWPIWLRQKRRRGRGGYWSQHRSLRDSTADMAREDLDNALSYGNALVQRMSVTHFTGPPFPFQSAPARTIAFGSAALIALYAGIRACA